MRLKEKLYLGLFSVILLVMLIGAGYSLSTSNFGNINSTGNITFNSFIFNGTGDLDWITPANVHDIDDEDIENDLNTYVDIAGDTMTDSLIMNMTSIFFTSENGKNISIYGYNTTIDPKTNYIVFQNNQIDQDVRFLYGGIGNFSRNSTYFSVTPKTYITGSVLEWLDIGWNKIQNIYVIRSFNFGGTQYNITLNAEANSWDQLNLITNGKVGVQDLTPEQTFSVDGNVSIDGFMHLVPRSSAPGSPQEGWIYADNDSHELCFYNSTDWIGLVEGGACS